MIVECVVANVVRHLTELEEIPRQTERERSVSVAAQLVCATKNELQRILNQESSDDAHGCR